MSSRNEFDQLKQTIQRRDRSKVNVDVATVIDTEMLETYGYVTAQQADGTTINVHAWMPLEMTPGMQLFVQPVTAGGWNWHVAMGVNSSTDTTTTPFQKPTVRASAIPANQIPIADHQGNLSWDRVDTTTAKVDLETEVVGRLPKSLQEPQAARTQLQWTTDPIDTGHELSGQILAPSLGWVRRVIVTGGSRMTLTIFEAPQIVEYQTLSVETPYTDYVGYCHASNDEYLRWRIANDGETASFQVVLDLVGWN